MIVVCGRRKEGYPLGDFLTLHSVAQLGGKFSVFDIYSANFFVRPFP